MTESPVLLRRLRRPSGAAATLVMAMMLIAQLVPPVAAHGEILGGAAGTAAAAPDQVPPAHGTPSSIDGLQHGDPAANVDLIEPPEVDNTGSGELRDAIDIPPGRLSWQPEVALAYGSSEEDGWLGMGWDASLDSIEVPGLANPVSAESISVDTRWGVPTYDPGAETETYSFGGEQLAPNAHRFPDPPVSPRADERIFTKRVEGSFLRIVRHGTSPQSYWWEVDDKLGNKYFYGGTKSGQDDAGRQDESSILTDGNHDAYWWGLKEKWDITTNVVTYFYDKSNDTGVGGGNQPGAPAGTQLYLSRINYTGSKAGSGLPRYGPYDVRFVRDSQLPGYQRRPDVRMEATGGGLHVTAELLRNIDVKYTPKGSSSAQLVRRYVLNYRTGPYNKTLLGSVDKTDDNGAVVSTKSFDYYNDVQGTDGAYHGFGPRQTWHTAGQNSDDGLSHSFLGVPSGSALGGSEAVGGDGRLFLGIAALEPEKLVAVGGGVQLGGSDGKTDIEMTDINGDNLPDKVWTCGDSVCYRLNTAQAGAPTDDLRFGPVQHADGLPHLGETSDFSVGAGAEVYVGANIMYNHTWKFQKQTSYLSDVNGDGLPDLVRDGSVLFNHRRSDGSVFFDGNSGTTEVPIDQTGTLRSSDIVPALPDVATAQAGKFPRQDTLHRWVAPADGDIEIAAPVRLADASKSPDGVRVAIQRNGTEIWADDIPGGDSSARVPTGVDNLHVSHGDHVYFRVGSKDNGAGDRVIWDPSIHYLGTSPTYDVNGKDVFDYRASQDFTMAGRTGTVIAMPYDGHIRVTGDIVKTRPTSDDIHARLTLNGNLIQNVCIRGSASGPRQDDCAVADGAPDTGSFPFSAELDVKGRHTDAAGDTVPGDKLNLRLAVDSDIDPTAIQWAPTVQYVTATDDKGNPVPTTDASGHPIVVLKAPYDADLYPNTNIALPQQKGDSDDVLVGLDVDRSKVPDKALPSKIILTAKTDDGVLRYKHTFTFPDDFAAYRDTKDYAYPPGCAAAPKDPNKPCTDDFHFERLGKPVYFDFTFGDAAVADATDPLILGQPFAKWWPGSSVKDDGTDVFPPSYRGWGYAGYNANDDRATQPVNEADLVLHKDDFPDPGQRPNGPDDPSYKNPVNGKAYPFVAVSESGVWAGPKFNASNPGADPGAQTPCPWPFQGCPSPTGTWGGPDQASASILGGDSPGAPPPNSIQAPGARAPTIYGLANQDSFSAGFLGLGGGVSTGVSKGLVDFVDMNGDGYPDTVGSTVQYTNQNGGLGVEHDPGLDGSVRIDHEFSDQAGAGGSPASISSAPDGHGNVPHGATKTGNPAARAGKGGGSGPLAGSHRGKGKKGAAAPAAGGKGGGGSKSQGGATIGSHRGGGKKGGLKKKGAKMLADIASHLGMGGELEHQSTNSLSDPQPDCDVFGVGCDSQVELADLNGDGLPDRVRVDRSGDMFVRWNLGYGFTDQEASWGGATLEEGSATSTALDIGLSFGGGLLDFSGGVDLSKEGERETVAWEDVNGDELDDRLSVDVEPVSGEPRGPVQVQLNTGTGLSHGIPFGDFLEGHISRTETTGIGGGADFTVGIPICPICPVDIYLLINPGFHVDKSHSTPRVDLMDVNGDGYMDSVGSGDDGHLTVALNQTGRTNLLKAVHQPLGSEIDVDYQRAGNTTAHPGSMWVVSSVAVKDGHAGDGADTQLTTYKFQNANFSYAEREDYGFSNVTEEQRDPATNAVYRSWDRSYGNDTYYNRGLLQSETLRNGSGTPVTSTTDTFNFVDATSATQAVADLRSLVGSVFPQLTTQVNQWYDSSGNPAKRTEIDYRYDPHGNLTRMADLGEPDTTSDDVEADMAYTKCDSGPGYNATFPWTQVASSVLVRSPSTVLKRREAVVPCDYAAATLVRDWLDPTSTDESQAAVTDISYQDKGGQLSEVRGPKNVNGDRYTVDYSYEDPDQLGSQVTKTTDSFKLTSTATYDNRFGDVVSTTDANGATTSYAYDDQDRLTSVTGPLEQGSGKATISYEYHTDASPPWAIARHVDPANPGTTIDTVQFDDGLGRAIQTKQDAAVFAGAGTSASNVMVVSGQTWYDAFGRPVKEYYPITEPVGTAGVFNPRPDAIVPKATTYTVLDQVSSVTEPVGRGTTESYGFAKGPFGTTMFTDLETDPVGARTRTYTDVREDVVGVEQLHRVPGAAEQSLFTRYDYDPLQRLTSVTSPGSQPTTTAYDLLGRRTSVASPDAGRTDFGYDLASNLTSKLTGTLRPGGKPITYSYQFDRIVGIGYPDNPGNNVTYRYGDGGTGGTAAGLLTAVDDGAHSETRAYDKLGNVVDDTDTLKVAHPDTQHPERQSFRTRFSYDTWGRPLSMVYPDGEVLTYAYDSGGLPSGATGVKGSVTYPYVARMEYDKFQARRFMAYGNGVTTETSYDDNTNWETAQRAGVGPNTIQDLHYAYDNVGNVLQRNDTRPLPPSGQKGGPSAQTFSYDDLSRLTSATGTYLFPPKHKRTYTDAVSYDGAGRVTQKKQVDTLDNNSALPTTYTLGYAYAGLQPHAPSTIGGQADSWDADGNLTSQSAPGTTPRTATWNEEDQASSIADGGNVTKYKYDDQGDLRLVSKPNGDEIELPNDYYAGWSGLDPWKNVWVGDLRVATKQVDNTATGLTKGEKLEYFMTSDLGHSLNVVTDMTGAIWQNVLYFPSGEIWVREDSDQKREPLLFDGQFFEDSRGLLRTGDRWYRPREGILYAADPKVTGDLEATVTEPRLMNAYDFAFDNPQSYVDDSGHEATVAQGGNQATVWRSGSRPDSWLKASPITNGPDAHKRRDSFFLNLFGKEGKHKEKTIAALKFVEEPALFSVEVKLNGFHIKKFEFKILGIKPKSIVRRFRRRR